MNGNKRGRGGKAPALRAEPRRCFFFSWFILFFLHRQLKKKRMNKKNKKSKYLSQHFFVRKETLPKETPRADFRSLFTCNCSFPKIFNSHFVLKHDKFFNGNFADNKYSLQYARVDLFSNLYLYFSPHTYYS